MGIPEAIVIFSSIGIIIDKINRKQIMSMSITYVLAMAFLKNTLPISISNLLLYFTIAIIIHIYSKVNLVRCFIVTALILGIKMITEVITITFISFTGVNLNVILGNNFLRTLSCYVSLLFMIVLMKILKYKYFFHTLDIKKISEKNRYMQHILLYISFLTMSIIGVLILLIYNVSNMGFGMEIVMRTFIVLALVIILFTLLISIINYDKRKALNELEKKLMEKNLKQMEENIDALRIQRHDYMNHLQIILMQMSSGKIEDAKRYILGMADCDSNISVYFLTGNHCIDAILNTKKLKASKSGIDLTACIDSLLENIELSDSEVSSILLNIIDNAIDELENSDKEYKYVHVEIYIDEGYHNICIKNNGSKIEDTKKIFEIAYSSKGENRGYGLYSIKQLLEEHNCSIDVESDDIETEFNIQIPIIYN